MKKRTRKLLQIAGTVLGAAVFCYCLWCAFLSDEGIWKNVSVNSISLKGLTKEEALSAIREGFEKEYKETQMVIRLDGQEYRADIFPMLSIDAEETVNQAYALGHGAWYKRGADRIQLMRLGNKKEELTLFPTAGHPEKLDEILSQAGLEQTAGAVETTCLITDTALVIKKGRTHLAPDMEKLKEAMLQAVNEQAYTAELDCPSVTMPPEEFDFQKYYDTVHKEAKNASYNEAANEIIPSVTGVSFDIKKAKRRLKNAEEGETVTIDLVLTPPEISTEDIEAMPYRDLLASFTTYGGGTPERIANLKLAVAGCDGVELEPWDTFSYNEALGPRTAERGYQIATVIVNGKHAQDIGGGICQVTTTLFQACLYADLAIVERHNHSGRVDYAEDGLDAAVVYGGQDFKFQNNSGYPVKITASYENGAVNVKLYGTRTNENTIKITTEKLDEQSCNTYRSRYDKDGTLLDTEKVAVSHYKE